MSTYKSNRESNSYTSPLEPLLADLRRKYVAAAGPQMHVGGLGSLSEGSSSNDSFLMEYSFLPSSVYPHEMEREGNFGDDDLLVVRNVERVERRKSAIQMGRNSSALFGRRRYSMRGSIGSGNFAIHGGGSAELSMKLDSNGILSPRPFSKQNLSASSLLGLGSGSGLLKDDVRSVPPMQQSPGNVVAHSFLDQRAAFLECTTRYNSGLASTSHADNLIACAPHLRHITPASADMMGHGTSSRNPITLFLMKQPRVGESTSEFSGGGATGGTPIMDYRTFLARKQANHRVALDLATFVRVLANEMPNEEFGVVENEIFSAVLNLMHSHDSCKRLAGVAALDALIGVASADEEKKITKIGKNLRDSLTKASNVDFEFLSEVTKALGKMARGGTNVDYMESVVKRIPEWLERARSDRRLAAVLTIKELAQNAPAAFYSITNQFSFGKEGDANEFIAQMSVMGQEGGTNSFITQIFPVLTDPQPIVRVCAADALAECLNVIVDPSRKHHSTTRTLCQIYSFVMQVFQNEGKKNQSRAEVAEVEASQHAALLVIGDLLEIPLDFMLPRFDEVCKAALSLKDHPKALIRVEVIRLLPRLARRCPGAFRRRYLGMSLKHIMEAARTAPTSRSVIDLRSTSYFALGQLILAVCEHESGGCFVPKSSLQFNGVCETVKGGKEQSNGNIISKATYTMKEGDIYANISEIFNLICGGLRTVRTEALHCGADVIEALGHHSEPHTDVVLDCMFHSGLSEDLISCLKSIAGSLPSKAYMIENRLLRELSLSLAGTSCVQDICDPLFASPFDNDFNIETEDVFPSHNYRSCPSVTINMRDNPETILKLELSLRTLRSFGNLQSRKGLSLLPFVRDIVAQYLVHPSSDVRREAALTCCSLLLPSQQTKAVKLLEMKGHRESALGAASILLLEEVLQKLLRAAVSDHSVVVRNCIICAFDERYDNYLCQAHHLPPLFLLLQDESLAVRAAALRLLGRIANVNPGPILPEMRRVLIQLITELKCSENTGFGKEASTRLLIVFFKANALHRLVHPFLRSIIEVLPLKGNAPRITSAALDALGELSRVVKDGLNPWMTQLIPLIMEAMQDSSSSNKQRTSFRTLGLLAAYTGSVVDLYVDYPRLLSLASSILPRVRKAPWPLRQEVIRTFGILGALDPDRFETSSSTVVKSGGLGSGYFINPEEGTYEKDNDKSQLKSLGTAERPTSLKRNETAVTSSRDNQFLSNNNADQKNGADESGTSKILQRDENEDDDEPAYLYMYELYAMTAQPLSKISPAKRLTPLDEEFYPTVALQALTSILKDPSLSVYHQISMQAIMFIFDSLGLRCVPFLKGIVPHILYTARTCGQATLREALLKQIARLSSIVKENLEPYVPDIFEVIEEFWDTQHLSTILKLIERISTGVPSAFKKYVTIIITRFLSSLNGFQSGVWSKNFHGIGEAFDRLRLILESIRDLRENLVEYIHILIPSLLKLADSSINPAISFGVRNDVFDALAIDSINTVTVLLQIKTPSAFKGQSEQLPGLAAQPLIRMLSSKTDASKAIGIVLVDSLCVCAVKIGKFRWLPLYHFAARNAIMMWHRKFNGEDMLRVGGESTNEAQNGTHFSGLQKYDTMIQQFVSAQGIIDSSDISSEKARNDNIQIIMPDSSGHPLTQDLNPAPQSSNQKLSQIHLSRSWDVSQKSTREDWDEWMRHFAIQLLREAPATALRATAELAYAYQPLARELFSAAFACCWSKLSDDYRASLIQALKTAFFADVSPEILQTLLNLVEYAERDGIPGGLPIEIDILAELALKCRSYAKALHYKEKENELGGGGNCIEDLITINRKLDLPEAALGVLKAAQFELERSGAQTWDQLYHSSLKNEVRTEFSSRIFHRHQGEGLAYSVMSSSDQIAGRSSGAWEGVEMQESWLAKLGSWSDALAMYERKLDEDPSDIQAVLGCMNCLNARGEWKRVLELSNKSFSAFTASDPSNRDYRKAIKFCAQASWRLGQWNDLERYSASLLDSNLDTYSGKSARADFDGSFFSAILNIHRKNWSLAAKFIDDARQAMDSRFTALMAESRKRAYPSMVTAQTLSEMEEIIIFRKLEERARASADKHRVNKDDENDARKRLIELWRKRLAGCRVDAEVHSSILAVRSLVLGPMDEVDATLTLSALSRQAQKYKLSERVLLQPLEQLGADLNSNIFGFNLPSNLEIGLLRTKKQTIVGKNFPIDLIVSGDSIDFFPPYGTLHEQYCMSLVAATGSIDSLCVQHKLYFAYVKHLWAMNCREEAMDRLEKLADVVDMVSNTISNEHNALRVSCWLKLGEWKISSTHSHVFSLQEKTQYEVLMALKRSTYGNRYGYKAWHTWALVNFRLAQQHDENRQNTFISSIQRPFSKTGTGSSFSNILWSHIAAAVQGFVKAICLGTKRWSASVQQDLLNFLTCLFRYGQKNDVAKIVNTEIGAVALEAWLGVLPQLLARIHMKSPSVRSVLHPLLVRLGEKHPQALMYPLSVLVKSPVQERKDAAENLMNSLKKHSFALVEDALMVSSELIRVAILWLELWHEGLEDASRLYFGEGNVSGMLDVLLPLHETLERGPSTRREQDFHKTFGRDLAEAYAYVKEYMRLIKLDGGKIPTQGGFIQVNDDKQSSIATARQNELAENAMNSAWDLYYTVFRKINKQLPGLTTLELSQCSPALLQAHNLELGVPGSYRVDGSFVKIDRFYPTVQVITSKQRPRKIVLRGGDGKDYVFLLKGHEDLRQDERVMQLFGLVNALLARDRRTNNHDLNIQRYTITPLSHNAGVVGWVPHCDTLHSLIRDYRASKRVPLNMENREMLALSQDYELLTVMQKVEIFSEALDRTTGRGNDIHDVLWIKSTNSEEWLDRRTKFTRSIAVMSMVGYILGLGDRHPSNLMLDQTSGRVLHIDFGDCFEVAMQREKFPETVPFRLTRMLVKAMEVSGVEGSYRDTCERTMTVLRDNRDSLVAMLEAFVYDPLISWRLLGESPNIEGDDLELKESITPRELARQEEVIDSPINNLGQLNVSHILVKDPIHEDSTEEDQTNDSSDRATTANEKQRLPVKPLSETFSERKKPMFSKSQVTGSLHSSHLRSLKMYSDIQNLASNLNVSSRIASITGDGTVRNFAAESVSRSRLDRSFRQKEAFSIAGQHDGNATEDALNEKALKVIRRVQDKLSGTDFHPSTEGIDPLDVQDQVQKLIVQATSTENLCQLFIGWCAFW